MCPCLRSRPPRQAGNSLQSLGSWIQFGGLSEASVADHVPEAPGSTSSNQGMDTGSLHAAVLQCCRPPITASFAASIMTSYCALQLSKAVALPTASALAPCVQEPSECPAAVHSSSLPGGSQPSLAHAFCRPTVPCSDQQHGVKLPQSTASQPQL